MPQSSTSFSAAEQLAVRMCRSLNARDATDAGPAIGELRRRSTAAVTDASIKAALERGWLRRDGDAYVVTAAGIALGRSRSGKRTGRVMPF